jgi:hypothetical protein
MMTNDNMQRTIPKTNAAESAPTRVSNTAAKPQVMQTK